MSEVLAQLHFIRPLWLWGLLALPVLAAGWQLRRRRANAWRAHVDPHLLAHLVESGANTRGIAGLLAQLFAWTIAVLALAGPSWRQAEVPLQQSNRALVVALDLSDAILATDLPPTRLAQARAKLDLLLRERSGGDVALVAFSDDAYTVSPLTDDGGNVAIFLDALSPGVMPEDGYRPDRAIEASAKLLAQAGHSGGDILLIGHAADSIASAAAANASAAGFRVSALGVGEPAGGSFRGRDGRIASSRLDADGLRRLAAAGGGGYAELSAGDADLAALGLLAGGAAQDVAQAGSSARAWRDEGYWLLLPLMLVALLAFRRGAAFVALAACLLLPVSMRDAWAQDAAAPEGNWWRRADQVEHARARDGIDEYRAGRYQEAEREWQDLPGADAAYNRGNALAKSGRFKEALAAYDDALRQRPGMEDAIANRAAVEAAMQRQPPAGGDQERERQGADEQRDGEGEGGEPSSDQDASPGKGEGRGNESEKPPQSDPADTSRAGQRDATPPPGEPQAADQQSQRSADEAQRQRMQEALDRADQPAEDGETVAGEPENPESEAERERRQAGEAWLRRVPDDPGGLLRARFRLEYERRNGRTPTP